MIGRNIAQYQILEKLGEGGMGVVYKAMDTKLDRLVALKFLPHHLAETEEEQSRFLQEAKAAAALNHPNVCSVIDIQTFEERQYIVMEYVDGATLRRKLPVKDIDEAVGYGLQIGEALQEAHARGIVHRDIKPDNIMVNARGQVKVMDFGLAKLKGALKLTRTSSTIGTLAYMAPEQIQGKEADQRGDIFSFGVVLYELLTGHLPFRGEHETALMYSILNEEPSSLNTYLQDFPAELSHIVTKALDKDPQTRYQTATDLIVDLRRAKKDSSRVRHTAAVHPAGSPSPPPLSSSEPGRRKQKRLPVIALSAVIVFAVATLLILRPWMPSQETDGRKTLAVLPFENQGSAEKEYFADGITEEITGRLSRLSGLGVIARASARGYKKTAKPIRQVAEELGVEYILLGTIRWSGTTAEDQRVRVTAELVRAINSYQIWSQPFDATVSDAFTLQSEIASEVARALDVRLLQPERDALTREPTDNPEAYDYYLKGLEYESRGTAKSDLELARQMYDQAITADPKFATAFASLSRSHSAIYWFFYDRSESRIRKAEQAANRALELDPNLSAAYAAKGWFYYHAKLEYDNALEQFELALKYQPNNADVYEGIAAVQRRQGKMRESIASWRKASEADPRSTESIRQLSETMTLVREYREADETFEQGITLAPDNEALHTTRVQNILQWTGDPEKVRAAIDRAYRLHVSHDSRKLLGLRITAETFAGNFSEARRLLNELPSPGDENSQFSYAPHSLLLAQLEDWLGDPRKAVPLYEAARRELERRVADYPDDERYHSALGIANAGLDHKEAALREAARAVELLPIEKEAWRGTHRLADLALVYTMVGEKEKAIAILERLLSIPSDLSPAMVKADPRWKPLRTEARFQTLVQ